MGLDHPFLCGELHTGPDHGHYNANVMANVPALPESLGLSVLVPGQPWPQEPASPALSTTSFQRISTTDGLRCSDLMEVERQAIKHILANSKTTGPLNLIEINNAAIGIASDTRRGAGDIVLLHPETLYRLRHENPCLSNSMPMFEQSRERASKHGWSQPFAHAVPTRPQSYWVKPVVPKNVAIVIYRGSRDRYDGGYFAIGHRDRPYFLANDLGRSKAHQYARVVAA